MILVVGTPILCFNRKGEVEQEPLKTKQARSRKSFTFTGMAQQHHHETFPSTFSNTLEIVSTEPRPRTKAQLKYYWEFFWHPFMYHVLTHCTLSYRLPDAVGSYRAQEQENMHYLKCMQTMGRSAPCESQGRST